jgi:hypothetical protein
MNFKTKGQAFSGINNSTIKTSWILKELENSCNRKDLAIGKSTNPKGTKKSINLKKN